MAIDQTGIKIVNEYFTNHYMNTIFEENAFDTINAWRTAARENEGFRTPWSLLRECARQYYVLHEKSQRGRSKALFPLIRDMADHYMNALGYEKTEPFAITLDDGRDYAYIYSEVRKPGGAPWLWILLSHKGNSDETALLDEHCFDATTADSSNPNKTSMPNEELVTKLFFSLDEAPRWIILIGARAIALLDRNKWNEKRYLEFDLDAIFGRREESTLQAMSVLLHKDSLCPASGTALMDVLGENSHRHANSVSQDLKYALREAIELLGNEVLYDMRHRQGIDLEANPVDAGELSIQCLRYMYRLLFLLFIEARPELGYAPIKSEIYFKGYSLESLRDIAEKIREELNEVGEGYYLHETLNKLFDLIYNGYPKTEEDMKKLSSMESHQHIFLIEPLKAHIFDPEYTHLINNAKLRNRVMLKIIDLLSISRPNGRRNERRGRISYSTLGINQLGAVYEALLPYRGFIAQETLYEVKRAGDEVNELDVGYFVPEHELENYTEEERARYPDGRLRKYEKGTFIYRLAGREREKSASYYTPEVLTKCLVKYALKELLEGKTADEILKLTVCEPAMGSAAFLNEVINQLAEAYLDRKQKELGESIPHDQRFHELQKVKMYIADRNVYGIDLNPVAVELAEVSLWLNTIYKGGYVPWFGTQLVCGNSLIGARRQCYRVEQLKATSKGERWYENAPERIPLGTKRMRRKQVYHFLTGDPGMSNYTDRVIKNLAPEKIRLIEEWRRKFTEPYNDTEIENLLRLSNIIDDLWEKQIKLRKKIAEKTADELVIYGQKNGKKQRTPMTIREKDRLFNTIYKSEEQKNAGPYARLKFAMDYWCALWFWPIDKAELLPTRSEFIADMYMILEGTINTFVGVSEETKTGQLSLFPSEEEQLVINIASLYSGMGIVDIPKLCQQQPRLALVKEIAEKHKFLHWELEFADLFAERGGFDLIIGNPPWIKLEWNEKAVLSDSNPIFTVKNLSATQTLHHREKAISDEKTKNLYFEEYVSITATQKFLGAIQNYPDLIGQQTNLYKCFLPQAWNFVNENGVSAFVHPDGVFDDPNGGILRKKIYSKLRYHFQFINEKLLFSEVGHPTIFSLNVYGKNKTVMNVKFDSISNLFDPSTVDQCYETSTINDEIEGIKDKKGDWNIKGHPLRIITYTINELSLLANLSDVSPLETSLLALHSQQVLKTIECFSKASEKLGQEDVVVSEMFHETYAQNDGTLLRHTKFATNVFEMVCSGPHIGVGNPLYKTPRSISKEKGDYDPIDLTNISEHYLPRTNYIPIIPNEEIKKRISLAFGEPINNWYRIVVRKMLNLKQERTLNCAIIPPGVSHINGLVGLAFKDLRKMLLCCGTWLSIPCDFLVKVMGKSNFNMAVASKLPVLQGLFEDLIISRTLLLNCLTEHYIDLYNAFIKDDVDDSWSKFDPRLRPEKFSLLSQTWSWNTPLRTDYERRQALVEIDVLVAMGLGMTLEQLKTIYRIQFPVLQQYEADTWYDQNGRIVFTNNRSLNGVGFSRAEFEKIKDAGPGEKFYRTIIDDTLPGGPVERTIEYVAPFDRCDREKDYEIAWTFFEKKYK